ncbi:MAG: MBL fold metallo-hydrolase [Saprospiraceae bacterium]
MGSLFSCVPAPIFKQGFSLFWLLFALVFSCQGQTLEIHQISVGQGDAGLIVVRDTAKMRAALAKYPRVVIPADRLLWLKLAMDSTVVLKGTIKKIVLIDAGAGAEQGNKIDKYLTKIGADSLDYTVLSHYHIDHFGGFKQLLDKGWAPKTAAYDRGNDRVSPRPKTGCHKGYINPLADNGVVRRAARADATDINLDSLGGNKIQLTCVISNGSTLGVDPNDHANWPGGNDENDYSVGWLVQYGAFRFYTGGDLNGLLSKKHAFETNLADSLITHDGSVFTSFTGMAMDKGHVCSMKLNHHGGRESTSDYFLSVLRPTTVLVSCGYSTSYYHPRIEVLKVLDSRTGERWDISDWKIPGTFMDNTIRQCYFTSMMDTTIIVQVAFPHLSVADRNVYKNIGQAALSNGVISGDVVVIVDDNNISTESKYRVYWNGEKATAVVTGAIREPNSAGTQYFQCHQATTLNYITNH